MDSRFEEQPSIPRMGLRHMMLWTLISAALMALASRVLPGSAMPTKQLPGGLQMIFALHAVAAGGVLTGAIVLIRSCIQHRRIVMNAPGHWIALALSIGYLLHGFFMLLMGAHYLSGIRADHVPLIVLFSLGYLLQAAVYMWALRYVAEPVWKGFLLVLLLTEVGAFLTQTIGLMSAAFAPLLMSLPFFVRELVVLIMLIVAASEVLRGLRRDWIHSVCMLSLLITKLAYFATLASAMFGA